MTCVLSGHFEGQSCSVKVEPLTNPASVVANQGEHGMSMRMRLHSVRDLMSLMGSFCLQPSQSIHEIKVGRQ